MGIPHYFRRLVVSFALISTFLWLYNNSGKVSLLHLQPKYNSFSCPGYITPAIKSSGFTNRNNKNKNKNNNNNTIAVGVGVVNPSPAPPPPRDDRDHQPILLPDFASSSFAYVFYATQSDYACSVLVNIDRLQNLFNTRHRIIVLVRPDLGSSYLTAFTHLNATVIPYSPPKLRDEQIGYYHDVLLKLAAFRLHHYIPSLKRVLVLDSDQLILQSLDHVFDLPQVDVAAPRAYWGQGGGGGGTGFTSAFLLVTLSDRVWDRMSQELGTIKQNVFDMDLVNDMFKQTVLMLPGDYATLNSHWETNDIPSWWMGDTPVLPYTPPPPPPQNQQQQQQQPPPEEKKVAPAKIIPPGEVVPQQDSSEIGVSEEPEGDELYNGQPVVQQRPQPTQQKQQQQQPEEKKVAPAKIMSPGEVVPQHDSLEIDVSEEPEGDELYNGQPVVQQRPQLTQQKQQKQQKQQQQQGPQLDQASPQPQASKQEQALPQQPAPKQEQATPQQAAPQQASSQQQASQKAESAQQLQPEIKPPTQPSQENPKHSPNETSSHPHPIQQQQSQQPPQHQQPPSSNSISQSSHQASPTQLLPTSETKNPPQSKVQRRSPIPQEAGEGEEEEALKRAYEEDQLKKRREIYNAVLYEIYQTVKVLHFTALGKPWSWHVGDVEEARPFAHDLFKVQFETWQNASWRLCNPEWR